MKKVRSRILQTKESLLRLALLLQRKKVLETVRKAGYKGEYFHPGGVSLSRHSLQSVGQDAPVRRKSELEQC